MLAAESLEGDDEDAGVLLRVAGDLDLACAPRLRVAVGDLMGRGVRHVELDLDDCDFIDSTGLGALLWASHRLDSAGGDLVVTNVHGAPARALKLSGVGHVIAVRPG